MGFYICFSCGNFTNSSSAKFSFRKTTLQSTPLFVFQRENLWIWWKQSTIVFYTNSYNAMHFNIKIFTAAICNKVSYCVYGGPHFQDSSKRHIILKALSWYSIVYTFLQFGMKIWIVSRLTGWNYFWHQAWSSYLTPRHTSKQTRIVLYFEIY